MFKVGDKVIDTLTNEKGYVVETFKGYVMARLGNSKFNSQFSIEAAKKYLVILDE